MLSFNTFNSIVQIRYLYQPLHCHHPIMAMPFNSIVQIRHPDILDYENLIIWAFNSIVQILVQLPFTTFTLRGVLQLSILLFRSSQQSGKPWNSFRTNFQFYCLDPPHSSSPRVEVPRSPQLSILLFRSSRSRRWGVVAMPRKSAFNSIVQIHVVNPRIACGCGCSGLAKLSILLFRSYIARWVVNAAQAMCAFQFYCLDPPRSARRRQYYQ